MSQAGFTPISLYHSTTAAATPSAGNLAAGELAVNITDGKLFYKDNGGVVRVLATAAGSAGDVVGPGSSTDNALVRFDGTTGKLVQNSAGVLDDSGNLTGLASLTATTITGALTGTVGATTPNTGAFTTLSASGAVTLSGGTANGVAYLNGSKVLTTGSALTFNGTKLQIGSFGSSGRLLETYGSEALFDGAGQFDLLMGDGGVAYMSLTTTDNATALKIRNYSGSSDIAVFERATGNVGIGTSSPGTALHVQRSSANAVLRLSSSGGSGRDWNINSQTDGYLTIGSDLLAGQLNLYQGNLGIGITAAARRLEVSGAGSGETYQLRLGAGNSNTSFTYDIGRSTVDGYFRFYGNQSGNNGYIFGGVDGERARITLGGEISFGKTQASESVSTGNGFGFASPQVDPFFSIVNTTSTGVNACIYLNRRNVFGTNTLIAFLSNDGSTQTGVGSITHNGSSTAYNTSSDYRLKTLVGEVTGAGDRIDALNPVEFDWNVNGQRDRGFFAHQFQAVYPNSVTGSKDAVDAKGKPVYQGMQASSSEVIADLVAEIQSLRKRLAVLESN